MLDKGARGSMCPAAWEWMPMITNTAARGMAKLNATSVDLKQTSLCGCPHTVLALSHGLLLKKACAPCLYTSVSISMIGELLIYRPNIYGRGHYNPISNKGHFDTAGSWGNDYNSYHELVMPILASWAQ